MNCFWFAGNLLQLSAQRSRQSSWISPRGGCKRTLVVNVRLSDSQCKARGQSDGEVSSTSVRESSGAKWGFDASTVWPKNFAQVGLR